MPSFAPEKKNNIIRKSIFKAVVVIFLFTNISYAHSGIDTTKPASDFVLNISANNNDINFSFFDLTYPAVKATSVASDDYYWDTNNNNGKCKRIIRGEEGNQNVGELFGGGILFYIYENNGGSNGLIG